MAQQGSTVQSPLDGNEGFIREFILNTNALDSIRLTAGDSISFDISANGYTVEQGQLLPKSVNNSNESPAKGNGSDSSEEGIGIVNLREEPTGNQQLPHRQFYPDFATQKRIQKRFPEAGWLDITLRPLSHTPLPTTSTVINVAGLELAKRPLPLEVTISPDHHSSRFISYDAESGAITLRVAAEEPYTADETYEDWIYLSDSFNLKPGSSPFLQDVWDKYETAPVQEGLVWCDNAVPVELVARLRAQIDRLAANEEPDYHPGSRGCVGDLVHPSLYPFVRGESAVTDEAHIVMHAIDDYNQRMLAAQENTNNDSFRGSGASRNSDDDGDGDGGNTYSGSDRWGRKYEASKYQWLPTEFVVDDSNGRVSIDGYINNLDREKYGELYDSLASLFEIFLPHMEAVYGYVQQLRFVPDEESQEDFDLLAPTYASGFSANTTATKLQGRGPVRVITKIVDYELRIDTDFVDGVFHVEGMSSDHVLLTGVYILGRDADVAGAELTFRRHLLGFEGAAIFSEVAQTRHWRAEQVVDENVRPLGKMETPEGRLIVFPNSHIHCLSRMSRTRNSATASAVASTTATVAGRVSVGEVAANLDDTKEASIQDIKKDAQGVKGKIKEKIGEVARRRVVVFWVVDPEREVLTTKHVPQQQGVMTEERAKQHRLALMEERRVHKGRMNGDRKVHLCEH